MWKKKNSILNRTISGAMGILMTAMSVFSPLATLPVYANESLIDMKYKGVKSDEAEIYVQSEGMSFEPGSSVELKVTVQNHTDKTLVDGGLSWRDNDDVLENKQFVLPDADEADENIASGSNVNSPAEINEKGSVTNITLAPGEKFEVVFTAAVDNSLELFSRRTIGFFFGSHHADDYDEIETKTMEFDFTAGLVTLLPVEFEDEDHEVEAGSTGSMTISLALDTSEYAYNMIHENLAPDSETGGESVATDANADDANVASDSNGDEKDDLNIASDSNGDEDDAETASGSNGAEDENEEDDEDLLDLEKIFYNITTYNVEFDNVEVVSAKLTEGSDGVIANIEYDVDEETPLGTYFGKIAAKVELDGRTYHATQGFDVTVAEPKQTLTAEQLAEVQRVLDLIAQLPTIEEYLAATSKFFFEDDTMDEEGFDAYIYELAKIAIPAFEAYQALSDAQKALIPAADVEKLEFIYGLCEGVTLEAESPHFKATWIDKSVSDGKNPVLKIYCKDENGNDLLEGKGSVNIANIADVGNTPTLQYAKKILDELKLTGTIIDASIEVNGVKTNGISNISFNDEASNKTGAKGWIYSTTGSYSDWTPWNDGDAITDNKKSEVSITYTFKILDTQPSVNENINITLYDYGSKINEETSGLDFQDGGGTKHSGHTLLDGTAAVDNGGSKAKEMLKTLDEQKYPAYKNDSTTKSLKYMFDDTLEASNLEYVENGFRNLASYSEEKGFTTSYKTKRLTMNGDGGLLQKDNEGYYVYDCSENAAYFNGERFEIYDALIAPGHRYPQSLDSIGNYWYNFLPFDKPYAFSNNKVKTLSNKNVFFTYYDGITTSTKAEASDLSTLKAEMSKQLVTNLWFGMTMDFNFRMPHEGKMENGNDMIFEFSGDDDVWVYIDDVLVLDIGGTHGRMDGSINFATGDVEYNRSVREGETNSSNQNGICVTINKNSDGVPSSATVETTLAALFKNSLTQGDKRLDALDGNTFKDYTSHTLKFYYSERGGNISFCKLKFNMPILPPNSLEVSKEVENPGDYHLATDSNYSFKVVKADSNSQETNELFIPEGTEYKLFDAEDNEIPNENGWRVGQNGIFTLKDGETAKFVGLLDYHIDGSKNYIVKEIDLDTNIYDVSYSIDGGGSVVGDSSTVMSAEKAQSIKFTNSVKPGDLSITKTVVDNDEWKTVVDNDEWEIVSEFEFEVKYPVNESWSDAEFNVSYQNTPASVTRASKVSFEKRPEETGEDKVYYAVASVRLYHGETVIIENLPAGLDVTVKEKELQLKPDGCITGCITKWTDLKDVNDDTDNITHHEDNITVQILCNGIVNTECTNEFLAKVTIDKIVTGNLGDRSQMFDFTADITDPDGAVTQQTFQLAHDSEPYVIKNVRVGSQVVITETSADGYKTSYKIGSESNDGNTATITKVPSEGIMIIFTNHKEATIDTGILLDSAPYLLTLAVALGGMAIYVINKRKKEDDELE